MEKSNQERLKEYLLGDKLKNELGYLQKDISNGKVIMLSGKWGSGKTFFWKNVIEKELIENQTKKQKAYVYSSLYGNRTLDKIEDNIYAQAYLCSVGGKNAVLSGYEKVKDFGKRFGSFCSLLDVSKLVDGIDDIQQKNIKKSALSYLENGGIVCFDDFERKSKDIDLNDLFGFISHLAIDLNCKVMIILNDDVFEGEEKKIFSNVKEKSVSKFLKYEPSIEELFETIFGDERYRILDEYKEIILKTIKETEELNARIYIQVLDNLVEWIDKNQEINDDVLRYLIFININFILYHCHFIEKKMNDGKVFFIKELDYISHKNFQILSNEFFNILNKKEININLIIDEITTSPSILGKNKLIDFINDNKIYIKIWYLFYKYKINHIDVNNIFFDKINNFIETGILINE